MGILALNLAEPHDVRDSRIHLAAGVLAVLALVAALCLLAGYGAFWGLLLGAPLVAIAKVVFDRIESLKPAGELLGLLGTDGNGGYRTDRSAGIYDNVRVKPLAECSDQASLTCAIQQLCAEKGVVAHVDIWTLVRSGKRQALCFVRTDRAAREERLAGAPGLTRFGNDLLFIVDLPAQSPNLL